MKKAIVTILAALVSQSAMAGELYCGANVSKVAGSNTYDKLLFWEKADPLTANVNYLLADGTLIRQKDLTPDTLKKITTGSRVLLISFSETGKPTLIIGKVKRTKNNQLEYKNTSFAVPMGTDKGVALVSKDIALSCIEM